MTSAGVTTIGGTGAFVEPNNENISLWSMTKKPMIEKLSFLFHALILGCSLLTPPTPRGEPIRLGCPPLPFPHSRSHRAHCRRGAQIHDLNRKNRFLRPVHPSIAGGALCLEPEEERETRRTDGLDVVSED
ncbi:hypothetical protein NQZ68_018936 [Dissostichus eleginoides]|nr:hypothetical protein NQZ68_018936 [Dissostichus eleginoides]